MTVWATRADQVDLRGPNPHDLARSPPVTRPGRPGPAPAACPAVGRPLGPAASPAAGGSRTWSRPSRPSRRRPHPLPPPAAGTRTRRCSPDGRCGLRAAVGVRSAGARVVPPRPSAGTGRRGRPAPQAAPPQAPASSASSTGPTPRRASTSAGRAPSRRAFALVIQTVAAGSDHTSRTRASTCSRSMSSGATCGPGRSSPFAHCEVWLALTPNIAASLPPPPTTSASQRVRSGASGSSAGVARGRALGPAASAWDASVEGEFDFSKDLAADLPLLTLAEVLGVPAQDRWLLFDWSNRVIGYQDPDYANSASFDPASGSELAREALRSRPAPGQLALIHI